MATNAHGLPKITTIPVEVPLEDFKYDLACSSREKRWQDALQLNLHYKKVAGARSTMDQYFNNTLTNRTSTVGQVNAKKLLRDQEKNYHIGLEN